MPYRGTKEYLRAYSLLIRAAELHGTVTYQDLAMILGLPLTGPNMGAQVGALLDEITEEERGAGRPMLGAVAVNVDRVPGRGFYRYAVEADRLASDASEEERVEFWRRELGAVYGAWEADRALYTPRQR